MPLGDILANEKASVLNNKRHNDYVMFCDNILFLGKANGSKRDSKVRASGMFSTASYTRHSIIYLALSLLVKKSFVGILIGFLRYIILYRLWKVCTKPAEAEIQLFQDEASTK